MPIFPSKAGLGDPSTQRSAAWNYSAAASHRANVRIVCRPGCAADVAEVQQKPPSHLRQSGAGLLKRLLAAKLASNHPDGFARLADELGERNFLAFLNLQELTCMKKKLIAIAVAGLASGAALAQTNVTHVRSA
jgi:hypothetical protein